MRSFLMLVAFCILTGPSQAEESASTLQPGARVRVTSICEPTSGTDESTSRECRSEGRLVQVSEESITVDSGDSTAQYRVNDLRRLEVSQNRKSRWLLGAGIGFVVGGAATYAVLHSGGSTSQCDQDANQDAMSSGECLGLTALGAVAGAGLGAAVGSFFHSQDWEDVKVQSPELGLLLGPGSEFGLGVTISLSKRAGQPVRAGSRR